MMRPAVKVAITLGDPAGVGPEVVLKALAQMPSRPDVAITLVGNATLLAQTYEQLNLPSLPPLETIPVVDVAMTSTQQAQIVVGQGNAASGDLSFRCLQRAIELALKGEFDAIATAPIAKSAWLAAGHAYPGQTELLAEMAGVERYGMLFAAKSPHTGWPLRMLLATTHIPLRAVPDTLTPALMSRKLELLLDCLAQDFGIEQARVAISGLNPHSGEAGQLGREEVDWLTPWIIEQQQRFPNTCLEGPIPPDTLWVRPGQAWQHSPELGHDAYLALYHDQGLIPVKLLAFDRAVNTTIGLPFVRTSPDHGTAFDIAGQNRAQADSMVAAIELAIELSQKRNQSALAQSQ
jgi:4-hydroxythreonine-4-phosphate dehydrogenase